MSDPIQKQPYAPAKRDWQDGLCSCTNDCNTCWCVLCCYPFYMCCMYRRYDQCCATPMAIVFPGLTLRVYHRGKHNIRGTLCGDSIREYCCILCAACQLDRDMKYMELTNGVLDV